MRHINRLFASWLSALLMLVLVASCTIEPPLHLPGEANAVEMEIPLVVTDLSVVWDVAADWKKQWYFGWDADDERLWGALGYPAPTSYEVRRYYLGPEPGQAARGRDAFTVYGNSFRKRYEFGYHDLLIWSNIDSPDGTQSVVIDERDPSNIMATTTRTRVAYGTSRDYTRADNTFNQPEVFYTTRVGDLYISSRKEDYDEFLEEEQVWVKRIRAELSPVVYIYLVQVLLKNNNGRIIGLNDKSTISGIADGLSLHTCHTTDKAASIAFGMRMKKDIDCAGETCDVLGGKFTSYGLCDMPTWTPTRATTHKVSRIDIENKLSLCMMLRGGSEAVIHADITPQVQAHPYGGVITVVLDVDDTDITVPPSDSGFDPTLEDYGSKHYEFDI